MQNFPFLKHGGGVSAVEKGLQVAAAMDDAKDKHVLVFNTVKDDILPHSHAAASDAEFVIAGTSDIGEVATVSAFLTGSFSLVRYGGHIWP